MSMDVKHPLIGRFRWFRFIVKTAGVYIGHDKSWLVVNGDVLWRDNNVNVVS